MELGFFGGEPLLEADRVLHLIDYAKKACSANNLTLAVGLTTNGTVQGASAWRVLLKPGVSIAVSHDGRPMIHDRHRKTKEGRNTSHTVLRTMKRLQDAGKSFRVVSVVGPDSVDHLPSGLDYLKGLGVRSVEPVLDLWASWESCQIASLKRAVSLSGEIWRSSFPWFGVGWFDEKLARILNLPTNETARCCFGAGEIAVAPSGRLYPCERLIGEDPPDAAMRLEGDALEGRDFLQYRAPCGDTPPSCAHCAIASLCTVGCRCSKYVRTGDTETPDRLLCLMNQLCFKEAAHMADQIASVKRHRKEVRHARRRSDGLVRTA